MSWVEDLAKCLDDAGVKITLNTNKCDDCGFYKPDSELRSYGADDGDTSVLGFQCIQCRPRY